MMAVKSPLMPSPNGGLMSAFSPYTDSPSSPAPYPKRTSTDSAGHLLPQPQRSPQFSSPTDIADPSPIAPSSNGTDTTDIEEMTMEEDPESVTQSNVDIRPRSDEHPLKVETTSASGSMVGPDSAESDYPSSVIHAPRSFLSFVGHQTGRERDDGQAADRRQHARVSPPSIRRSTPTPSQRSDITVTSPPPDGEFRDQENENASSSSPPISTQVDSLPQRDWSATPRAHTRQEAEAMDPDKGSRGRSSSLEDIPETQDGDVTGHADRRDSLFEVAIGRIRESADEVAALKLALSECWTLCNTLAGLSHVNRERVFKRATKTDDREQAWKSCWKLCKRLYDTRDDDQALQIRPILDLCRDFCQSLFEVRQRENDVADSVLRVSFELNNHLYNTHDRTLPEAFRERTLDFYITLCHRLMKQRTRLGEEADALLRACWSLAEMLFSLRQNHREGKPPDEDLLGSAVQACWELCDLFREGWTQVRPDRGTPRPSQTTFTQVFQQVAQSDRAATISVDGSDIDEDDSGRFGRLHPETPTTVFEDTQQLSPDDGNVPNILVLGPESHHYDPSLYVGGGGGGVGGWVGGPMSSATGSLSGYSEDQTSSSTSTIMHPAEDSRLTCLKLLVVKAAMNAGYQRGGGESLAAFVAALPGHRFGTAGWQLHLLEQYKKLVATDPAFRMAGPARRASARDMGRAVQWMVRSGRYGWLRDLFRLVLGFDVEEGGGRGRGMGFVQS